MLGGIPSLHQQVWVHQAHLRLQSVRVQPWQLLGALFAFCSVCTDVHTRLLAGTAVLQLGCIFSPRSSQMLSLQSFCGLLRAPRQAAIKAQLSFVSAFEALVIHLSSQIPACTLGKAFPRGEQST